MQDKIFIPSKIKVGYNQRSDTYTKKLAYIIYYDAKNILRQEKSWESWREKKLGADDFDNVPTEGFVLNKGVGGARESYGWNTRNEYIRIYDPRGFEFEISVANLLYILQETNSIKGKGLEGEFVYGYYNQKVVLLPTCSKEYKECMNFSATQAKKVSSKELILGATYQTKQMGQLIYLGRYNCYGDLRYNAHYGGVSKVGHDYIFYDEKNKYFFNQKSIENIAAVINDTCHTDFAALVEKLEKKENIGKIKDKHIFEEGIRLKKGNTHYYNDWDVSETKGREYSYRDAPDEIEKFEDTLFLEVSPNTYQVCNLFRKRNVKKVGQSYSSDYEWTHVGYGITSSRVVTFENDEIVVKSAKNPYKDKLFVTSKELKELKFKSISITLKSGKRHKLFKD